VVVLGLDCPNGLQTARVFADRGIDVVGVATRPRHACVRTRACSRKVLAAPRPDGLVASLLTWPEQFEEGSVIVPCTDRAVLGVARHRTALSRRFRIAVPSLDVIEILLDKARFADFAVAHGLPVPQTRVLRSRGDAEDAAQSIGFPCVLKPSIKTVAWERNSAAKAVMVDHAEELPALYDRLAPWTDAMVVQEWVAGGDTDHYTCDCYVAFGGEPLATWVTRKLRQWPPVVGQACLSVECRNDDVRDETLRVLRAAGHHGQGYVEMKWDARSGRHLILEANVGRPTGRSTAAEKGGVELLMTMYCDLIGAPLPEDRTQRYRGSKWIHIRRDAQASIHALLRGTSGPREIIRSWRGPFTFALFSWRDPVPFFADLAATLWRLLRSPLSIGALARKTAFRTQVHSDVGRRLRQAT
jgi:predicted ATP-grasp superfamily ATP-dependent carboligase